jgi:hypothetical protein
MKRIATSFVLCIMCATILFAQDNRNSSTQADQPSVTPHKKKQAAKPDEKKPGQSDANCKNGGEGCPPATEERSLA